MTKVSIVVPVLNEAVGVVACLNKLQNWRQLGHEVIVVDGGSDDDTVALSQTLADQVITAPPGRASQMNAGAAVSRGELLLFLHADSTLPRTALDDLVLIAASNIDYWGRFDVRLSGAGFGFRVVETMMNWRSRITGIATGDQAIFVSRALFSRVSGFKPLGLMEDIELSSRLNKIIRPQCLSACVVTSSRRWEQQGLVRTVLHMWGLRLLFFFGVNADTLARYYRHVRSHG